MRHDRPKPFRSRRSDRVEQDYGAEFHQVRQDQRHSGPARAVANRCSRIASGLSPRCGRNRCKDPGFKLTDADGAPAPSSAEPAPLSALDGSRMGLGRLRRRRAAAAALDSPVEVPTA